jgi:UDP-N-acetylglucosamine:LPS N-acetylglucosamine transferase
VRVVAICRGAPGLGRVVPSLALVQALAEAGPVTTKFASYEAGARYLAVRGEDVADLGRPDGLFIDSVAPQALQVRNLIHQDRPDMVLVDGEFYLPATLADLDVPVVYLANPHDLIGTSNVFRRVNRLLLTHADAVLISSLSCAQPTAHPDLVAGTPCLEVPAIAKNIPLSHRPTEGLPRVLVCTGGGSIGSHPGFRKATDAAVARVLDALGDLVAESNVGTVSLILGADVTLPDRWQNAPRWLHVTVGPIELADLYPHHDLLVARAGRNTTAEAAFCGIPAVLLPITTDPHRGDEQADNADALAHLPGIFPLRRWHDAAALRQTLTRALLAARRSIRVSGRRGNDSAVAFVQRLIADARRPLTTVS